MQRLSLFRKAGLTLLIVCGFSIGLTVAQEIGVFNSNQKKITTLRQGKIMDIRLNADLVYPDGSDSIIEARVFGEIDTIIGDEITLIQTDIILNYSKQHTYLMEEAYEYTELKFNISDIKGLNHTPTMQSVGNAFITLGVVALLASPLLGVNPSGGSYIPERFYLVAGIGGVSAALGLTLYFSFRQRPFQFKKFDGPDYFKRYQAGSLSLLD